MPKFSIGRAKQSDRLDQLFSFSGKIRGADVLLRLVEVCGYKIVHEALEELKPVSPAKREIK